jgi:ParB family chromosome partitioning protein
MRHDEHYVESLAASAGDPIGRLVPIDLLDPNPNQPRQLMGDLSELMASVAEQGSRSADRPAARQLPQIIAGERRFTQPCRWLRRPVIIREVGDTEVMEIAPVENLQRKDLTAEARKCCTSSRTAAGTHEDMARKLGKSRTAVTGRCH